MAAHTIFPTKTIVASLVAIGIAGAAQAQAPSTLAITGHAPSTLAITSHAPGQAVGNIVGGGNGATISGGGDDAQVVYTSPYQRR